MKKSQITSWLDCVDAQAGSALMVQPNQSLTDDIN